MKVSSKVKLNMGVIRQLSNAATVSLEQTAEALMGDLKESETMPFDKGTLQNTDTFVDDSESRNGKVSVVSSTPYARRLYYHPEYNFSKSENANADGKWFEPYTPGGKKQDFAEKTFAKLYKKNGGV